MTESQRAILSVDFLPELEEEAKKRQGRRTDLTSSPSGEEVDHLAVDDAAKLTGASTRNIQRAKRVAAEAPDLAAELTGGATWLDAAN